MKKVILLVIVSTVILSAQSFQEYKKEQSRAYKDYQNSMDVKFLGYLKEQWSYINQEKPKELYKEKKPKILPATIEKKVVQNIHEITIPVKKPIVVKEIEIPVNKVLIKKDSSRLVRITYYGLHLSIPLSKSLPTHFSSIKQRDDFSVFWEKMSHYNYTLTLSQIQRFRKKYQLNGWSVYQVVNLLSEASYSQKFEQKLFSWLLLNKLGYKVKVGYKDDKIVLLSATNVEVFSTLYFTLNSTKYYALDYYLKKDLGSLYTYKKDFPNSTKLIDFSMKKLPLFPKNRLVKKRYFKEFNLSIDIPFNRNMLAYLQSFPQVGYSTYFDTTLYADAQNALVDALYPLLEGKPKTVALNILLHFVQKSFAYETDWKQFGYEKVMFPSETLYYNYSDCDDRAVLFAYLAQRLLDVDIVGLKFSNHMATAVEYDSIKKNQDYIQKDKFIVSDPTYINANVGQVMPQYLYKNATIITSEKSEKRISMKQQKIVRKE